MLNFYLEYLQLRNFTDISSIDIMLKQKRFIMRVRGSAFEMIFK